MAAPTLTDLRAHLNIDDTANEAELQAVLDAAVELVEQMVGPLSPTTVTDSYWGEWGSPYLLLRHSPVVAVTSVDTAGSVPTTVSSTDYVLDTSAGLVRLLGGRRFAGDYTVTYTAGWDLLPAPIRLGCLIIAAHLYDTQRVPGARRSTFGQTVAEQQPTPMGFAVPNRAATLLEPYRLPVIA